MTNSPITAIEPTPGTLVGDAYEKADYRDAFIVETGDQTLEEFAAAFFLSQPAWIGKVSMNLTSHESRGDALGDRTFPEGSSVGSWRIHGRSDDEILFGEHMGFMEYRFSMLHRDDGFIEASTSVKYLKRLGPIYFGIVKHFHRLFVKVALRNAANYEADDAAVVRAST